MTSSMPLQPRPRRKNQDFVEELGAASGVDVAALLALPVPTHEPKAAGDAVVEPVVVEPVVAEPVVVVPDEQSAEDLFDAFVRQRTEEVAARAKEQLQAQKLELEARRGQRDAAVSQAHKAVYDQHGGEIARRQETVVQAERQARLLLGDEFMWVDPATLTNPFEAKALQDWREAARRMADVDNHLERVRNEAGDQFDADLDALEANVAALEAGARERDQQEAERARIAAEQVVAARKNLAAGNVAREYAEADAFFREAFGIAVGDVEMTSPTDRWTDAFETTRDAREFEPGSEVAPHAEKSEQLQRIEEAVGKVLDFEQQLRASGMSSAEIRDVLRSMSAEQGGVIPMNFLPYYCCDEVVAYEAMAADFEQARTAERAQVAESLKSELGEDIATARGEMNAVKGILRGPIGVISPELGAAVDLLVLGANVMMREAEARETTDEDASGELRKDNFQAVSVAVLGAVDADLGKAVDRFATVGRSLGALDSALDADEVQQAANSIVAMTQQIKRDRAILAAADKLFDAVASAGDLAIPGLAMASSGKQILVAAAAAIKRIHQYNEMVDLMCVAEARDSELVARAIQNRVTLQKIEISKQTIKGVTAGIQFAGGVVDLAGPAAPVGTALKTVGKAADYIAEKAFKRYKAKRLQDAWKLYKRVASLGHNDRVGMLEVLEKHNTLAKYALAYAALKDKDRTAIAVFQGLGLTAANFEARDATVRNLVDYMTVKGDEEADSFDEPEPSVNLATKYATKLKDKIKETGTPYNPNWSHAGTAMTSAAFNRNCERASRQAGFHRGGREPAIAKALDVARICRMRYEAAASDMGPPPPQIVEYQRALEDLHGQLRAWNPTQSARGSGNKRLAHQPMVDYGLFLTSAAQAELGRINDAIRERGALEYEVSVGTLDANIRPHLLNPRLSVQAWNTGIAEVQRAMKAQGKGTKITDGKSVAGALSKWLAAEAALEREKADRDSLLNGRLEKAAHGAVDARDKLKQELMDYRAKHAGKSQRLYDFVTECRLLIDRIENPMAYVTLSAADEIALGAQLDAGDFDGVDDFEIDDELQRELDALADGEDEEMDDTEQLIVRTVTASLTDARKGLTRAKTEFARAADDFSAIQDQCRRRKAAGAPTAELKRLQKQLKLARKVMRQKKAAHDTATAAAKREARERRVAAENKQRVASSIIEHIDRHADATLRFARALEAESAAQVAQMEADNQQLMVELDELFEPMHAFGRELLEGVDVDERDLQ